MFALGVTVGVVAGAAIGAILAWMFTRARSGADAVAMQRRALDEQRFTEVQLVEARMQNSAASARLEEWRSRMEQLEAELAGARDLLHDARAETAATQAQHAALEAGAVEERKAAADKLKTLHDVLAEAETKFRETFAALSSDALRRNNQSFIDLARETMRGIQQEASGELERRQQAIGEIVKPIRESLDRVDEKIHDIEKARVDAYATLNEQVRSLADTQQHLYAETSNLVKALRTPNVRGRWGEIQLRRVVELAGMLEHCDFDEQRTLEGDNGRIRPDIIVRLAGDRCVVVDAKTPLDAYLSALEAPDDEARAKHLKQHVKQLRDHIGKLGQKQYWAQVQPSPDVVVMFVPGETILNAAIEEDATLFEYAVTQRVMLATPWNLVGLLQAVAYGWRQERLAEHAAQISEIGRVLYDRLCKMGEHFDRLRRNLDGAVDAYNATVGSLESRVLVSARRFGELGVATAGDLPELSAIDRATRSLHALPIARNGDGDDPCDGEGDPDRPPEYLAVARQV